MNIQDIRTKPLMNAFTFSIQGCLKPIALRHHVFALGNTLGIRGFLNYRRDMFELYIHAEGDEGIMLEFILQVNQFIKKHRLVCFTEEAPFEDYQNFKILLLRNEANNEPMHSISDNPNTDHSENDSAENRNLHLQSAPIEVKKYIPGIRKVVSSFKHAGFW